MSSRGRAGSPENNDGEVATSIVTEIDWRGWAGRWDRQQEGYLPDREGRFRLMLDLVRTVRRDHPGRITWLEADLRREGWDADLKVRSFDAILSATAIHWFQPEDQVRLYRRLAALLAEDGIFLNADHFPLGEPTLDPLAKALLKAQQDRNFAQSGMETWNDYWEAARAEPALAALLVERERRFGDRQPAPYKTAAFHREALLISPTTSLTFYDAGRGVVPDGCGLFSGIVQGYSCADPPLSGAARLVQLAFAGRANLSAW